MFLHLNNNLLDYFYIINDLSSSEFNKKMNLTKF